MVKKNKRKKRELKYSERWEIFFNKGNQKVNLIRLY